MPFNDLSMSRLQGVDPRLVDLITYVRKTGGVPFEITEGLRDMERQRELYDDGASRTLNSKHLTGRALDIHLLDPETGEAIWDEEAYAPLGALAKAYAERHGLPFTWGGDWGWDSVHFQLDDGPTRARAAAGLPLATRTPPAEGRGLTDDERRERDRRSAGDDLIGVGLQLINQGYI